MVMWYGLIQFPETNEEPMESAKEDETPMHLQVDRKKMRMTTMGMTPKGLPFIQTTSVSQVTFTGNFLDVDSSDSGIKFMSENI